MPNTIKDNFEPGILVDDVRQGRFCILQRNKVVEKRANGLNLGTKQGCNIFLNILYLLTVKTA